MQLWGLMIASALVTVNVNAVVPPPGQCNELYIIESNKQTSGQAEIQIAKHRQKEQVVVIKTFELDDEFALEHMIVTEIDEKLQKFGGDTWFPKQYPPCVMPARKSPSLVMEYVPKEFNFDFETPLDKLADVLHQVLWAVTRMHNMGYSHNDLKEGNIQLNNTDQVKLIDFGYTSNILKPFERSNIRGSLLYMPPEMLRWLIEENCNMGLPEGHEKQFTPIDVGKLDSWSLGIITFKLLTNTPIYDDNELKNRIKCIPVADDFDLKIYAQYFYLREKITGQAMSTRSEQEKLAAQKYPIIDECLKKLKTFGAVKDRFYAGFTHRIEVIGARYSQEMRDIITDYLWQIVGGLLEWENNARLNVHHAFNNKILRKLFDQSAILPIRSTKVN